MNDKTPLEIQLRWVRAAVSGDFSVFDEIVSEACVDHDPAPGQSAGPDGYKMFFAQMRAAFPDLMLTPEHVISSSSELAVAYTIEGTHLGRFMGVEPTGRYVKARGMQMIRFENGRAVERWGSSDELGILRQIGAMPEPWRQ